MQYDRVVYIILALFFLPTVLALLRRHNNRLPIMVLNILPLVPVVIGALAIPRDVLGGDEITVAMTKTAVGVLFLPGLVFILLFWLIAFIWSLTANTRGRDRRLLIEGERLRDQHARKTARREQREAVRIARRQEPHID